ncbi:C40 family peptidase [Halothermothrix orenii]|uniref:NLP/P60 protein n=1 Tax=Halothermothrix orenii (strain H 168 / OCM 544 / DSM 9562) TaxID=373903 RepID=B8CYK5_HALOH|nr:NlpC/P60 family protein [Halothermothrix orenii]ACL70374.1 NLP/P60 protein [Halothermothrix orenii H 168]
MDIEIKKIVNRLIGIPYKHNGRSYQGVDCWGLVYLFFKELGVDLPVGDGEFVPDDWYKQEPDRYIRGIRTLGEEVGHYRYLKPLDIPYFKLYRNVITHSGVMVDDDSFIHVLINKEVRLDSMSRKYWKRKYAGAIRLTGL